MSSNGTPVESVQPTSSKEKKRQQNRIAQRMYRRNQRLKIQSLGQAVAQAQGRRSLVSVHPAAKNDDHAKLFDETLIWDLDECGVPYPESDISTGILESQFDFDITLRELSLTSLPASPPDVARPLPALHRAVIRGDAALCVMLLQNGADIHKLDSRGKSVVDIAVEAGDLMLLKSILDIGKAANVLNSRGRTALFAAMETANEELAKMLLEYQVDVNCPDLSGDVALHLAVELGSADMARLLLQYGADANI